MTTQYWLVKQEPEDYAWEAFVRDGKTAWTGVRNYAARNHLKAMQAGDEVFYYHSGDQKSIVGLAKVAKPAYPDPTADRDDDTKGWVAVDLKPVRGLKRPVALSAIKTDRALKEMALLKISRLSVQPVRPAEFARILQLAGG